MNYAAIAAIFLLGVCGMAFYQKRKKEQQEEE